MVPTCSKAAAATDELVTSKEGITSEDIGGDKDITEKTDDLVEDDANEGQYNLDSIAAASPTGYY